MSAACKVPADWRIVNARTKYPNSVGASERARRMIARKLTLETRPWSRSPQTAARPRVAPPRPERRRARMVSSLTQLARRAQLARRWPTPAADLGAMVDGDAISADMDVRADGSAIT